jgi:SSS family solute:Na+ symporter
MHLVSLLDPPRRAFAITDIGVVDMQQWKYAKVLSIVLTIVTLAIYVWLGSV